MFHSTNNIFHGTNNMFLWLKHQQPSLPCCVLQTFPYRVREDTGIIDYDQLEANAALYRPKLIVAGASAYTRHYDYPRMRQIADKHNAWLLSDMAHISGLVAAGNASYSTLHSAHLAQLTYPSSPD